MPETGTVAEMRLGKVCCGDDLCSKFLAVESVGALSWIFGMGCMMLISGWVWSVGSQIVCGECGSGSEWRAGPLIDEQWSAGCG